MRRRAADGPCGGLLPVPVRPGPGDRGIGSELSESFLSGFYVHVPNDVNLQMHWGPGMMRQHHVGQAARN
jgi:hypothetical protein